MIGRIARVSGLGDAGLCRLKNISSGGAMIETCLDFRPGDRIEIGLTDHYGLTGRVAWSRGEQVGIRFQGSIDPYHLLRQLAQDHWGGRSRNPRLRLMRPASIESSLVSGRIMVEDISRKGMKIRCAARLPKGLRISICFGNGIKAQGAVCWSDGACCGIEFASMLAIEQLGSVNRF